DRFRHHSYILTTLLAYAGNLRYNWRWNAIPEAATVGKVSPAQRDTRQVSVSPSVSGAQASFGLWARRVGRPARAYRRPWEVEGRVARRLPHRHVAGDRRVLRHRRPFPVAQEMPALRRPQRPGRPELPELPSPFRGRGALDVRPGRGGKSAAVP